MRGESIVLNFNDALIDAKRAAVDQQPGVRCQVSEGLSTLRPKGLNSVAMS